jgi:hypothetical protein
MEGYRRIRKSGPKGQVELNQSKRGPDRRNDLAFGACAICALRHGFEDTFHHDCRLFSLSALRARSIGSQRRCRIDSRCPARGAGTRNQDRSQQQQRRGAERRKIGSGDSEKKTLDRFPDRPRQ